ncbi:MAG: DOPA 4,5-dioxygenase family protein [Bdellovibrionota bacterium]
MNPAISGFHAHVYFGANTKASAEKVRLSIEEQLASKLRYSGKLIDRPVGPHPEPMFEINFLPEYFGEVVTILMQNHGDHSVLIHPETGNDMRDHTTYALWLGKQLSLDLSKLSL